MENIKYKFIFIFYMENINLKVLCKSETLQSKLISNAICFFDDRCVVFCFSNERFLSGELVFKRGESRP